MGVAPAREGGHRAVGEAGLTTALGWLVPDRSFAFDGISEDQAAIGAGVSLSDIILTIRERPKEKLSASIRALHSGLTVMAAGRGLLDTVDELATKVDNDAISREELLTELEAIVSMSMPELGFGQGDRTGPLLQAGAWTAGVNLIGKAILKEDKTAIAGELLRLEGVANYFLKYVDEEGSDKAPEAVLTSLRSSLLELKRLSKQETIADTDIKRVVQLTDQLLQII